jgi:RNA polymerase sigma factor (sigma-70 family)
MKEGGDNAYRVKVSVRNNKFLSAMESCGYTSVRNFAIAAGIEYSNLNRLIGMRVSPLTRYGTVTVIAAQAMEFMGASLEDLWTVEQLTMSLKRSSTERAVGADTFRTLLEVDQQTMLLPSLEEEAITADRASIVTSMVKRLTKREQQAINMRYVEDLTYAECGERMKVSSGRVQQIEAKALRKLRHPRLRGDML